MSSDVHAKCTKVSAGQLGVVAKHVGGLVELVVDVVFHGLTS